MGPSSDSFGPSVSEVTEPSEFVLPDDPTEDGDPLGSGGRGISFFDRLCEATITYGCCVALADTACVGTCRMAGCKSSRDCLAWANSGSGMGAGSNKTSN